MNLFKTSRLAALLLPGLLLGGCDDETLMTPVASEDALFDRYVALGNSITAGFQSGGINSELQLDSYAVLVAEQMGTAFESPLLTMPGCPPPFVDILAQQRVADLGGEFCALREADIPRVVNNVAVPGAKVIDLINNLDPGSSPNPLTTFFLGGRTQAEAAADASPTFASVWIGNNDVLGAATSGDASRVTPQAGFEASYETALDALVDAGTQGGVLLGVANVTVVPNLSAGAAYYAAVPQGQGAGLVPPNLAVDDTCVPTQFGGVGDQVFFPFQYGATVLGVAQALFAQAGGDAPTITMTCAVERTVEETVGAAFGGVENIPADVRAAMGGSAGLSMLTADEMATLGAAVAGYNDFIQTEASARGWAYVDPNVLLLEKQALGEIPLFPDLANPSAIFGPWFSLDGVHPSSLAHVEVANAVIEGINARYGTSISRVVADAAL